MRKRKEIQGLAVVDVSAGKKLGTVDDLVVSPESGRVAALTLTSSGFGGPGSYVAAEDVKSIGPDAVTVEGEGVVHELSEMPDGLAAARDASRGLPGSKVVSESGALLGTISDYLVDESALRVSGLTIGGGLLSSEDSIAADRILSVGPDAVIVTDADGDEPGARRSAWAADEVAG